MPVAWSSVLVCTHQTRAAQSALPLCKPTACFESLLPLPAGVHLTKLTVVAESWDTCACTRSQKVSVLFLVRSLCQCQPGFLHCPKLLWQHSSLRAPHAIPTESPPTACANLGGLCQAGFWC